MNNCLIAENVSIGLDYSHKYLQSVEDGEPDKWINISIKVGETHLYGAAGGVRGFAWGFVDALLDSIDSINKDERHIIELEYGPTWLIIEPNGSDSVNVARCTVPQGRENPEKRLDIDKSQPVYKQVWINEVLRVAEEFYSKTTQHNPELTNKRTIKDLNKKMQQKKK